MWWPFARQRGKKAWDYLSRFLLQGLLILGPCQGN